MRRIRVFTAVSLAALFAASSAHAIPITPAAFGSGVVVESFEGLVLGPNLQIGMGASLLLPGTVSAYAFPSGVTLTTPVPNPGVLNQGPFVHDFARGTDVTNNWGATGVVNDAGDVPFGDAYLGAFHPSTGTVSFTLSFATPMDRVGAYVTGVAGSTITMQVYDAGGALLETVSAGAVALGSWSSNFLGIQRPEQISRVVFVGRDFGIDGFHYENEPLLVPEPATLQAMLLGLLGMTGLAALGRTQRETVRARAR